MTKVRYRAARAAKNNKNNNKTFNNYPRCEVFAGEKGGTGLYKVAHLLARPLKIYPSLLEESGRTCGFSPTFLGKY